jgi:D-Tyr-tRNAtyr deacylase
MGPEKARQFFSEFVQYVKTQYKADKVHEGAFGEYMQVALVNDGTSIPFHHSYNRSRNHLGGFQSS